MRSCHTDIWRLARMKLLFFFLVSLVGLTPVLSQTRASGFDQQIMLAQQCVARRDWNGAISNYRQALTLNSQSDYAYIGLGTALLHKGDLDESEAALAQALALIEKRTGSPSTNQLRATPNRVALTSVLDNLAFAYYQANRLEAAFKVEEMAIRVQPDVSGFWNTRGMILDAQGKLDDAVASYRKASDLSPRSTDILQNLSEALQKGGHFEESISVLRQALALNPYAASAARLQTSLGNVLYARERFSEAEAAYQASLALRARDSATLYGLSLAQRAQGKYADALTAGVRAHELAPDDSDTTLGLASLYAEMGRYDEAASLTRAVASTSAGDPVFLLLRADSLIVRGQAKEAVPLVQQALAARPDFPEASAALASLQIDFNQVPKGLEMVKAALTTHPSSPDVHNALGLLLAAQSHLAEAQGEFEKTLALRPNFPDAMVNHAVVLARQNHLAEAITEFQDVLAVNPKNLKAQANLAGTLLAAKRYDDAAAAFRLAIVLAPTDPDLRTNLGLALQRAGHAAEARQAFAEAEKLRQSSKRPTTQP
jgi:tetratricopeptide (TPR) repeat protein